MSRRGSSRLWRKLNPNRAHASVFEIATDTMGTLTDADVCSIKITRGADSANPGLSPSMVEYLLPGARYPKTNTGYRVQLSQSFASAYGLPITRAMGRVGTFDTDDNGSKFSTTVQGVHWSSLLTLSSRKVQPTKDENVTELVRRALQHPELTKLFLPAVVGSADDTVNVTTEWTKTSQVLDTYATGTGMQLRETRVGTVEVLTLTRRLFEANQSRAKDLPILRREGIAPAKWAQEIDGSNTQYVINRNTADGVPYTQKWTLPSGMPITVLETQELDWTNIRCKTENYSFFTQARTLESNWPENALKELSIDLSALLASKVPYDRALAAQAINYEVGAHIMLGGDWPPAVRGRYFAQQITEEITPDGWRMSLSLTPASRVVGMNYTESQDVPAYTWAQLNGTWKDRSGTWADAKPPVAL